MAHVSSDGNSTRRYSQVQLFSLISFSKNNLSFPQFPANRNELYIPALKNTIMKIITFSQRSRPRNSIKMSDKQYSDKRFLNDKLLRALSVQNSSNHFSISFCVSKRTNLFSF